MISEQSPTNDSSISTSLINLNDKELNFLNLLKKLKDQKISIRYKIDGLTIDNFDSFSSYYSISEVSRLLECLAFKKILYKKENGTILLCPKCDSHSNLSLLACPKCNSIKPSLIKEITHHECNYTGPSKEFADGVLIRCPNCECILNENAQEGEPEYFSISDPYFICSNCGTILQQNNYFLICGKCKHMFSSVQAHILSIITYSIKPEIKIEQHPIKVKENNVNKEKNRQKKKEGSNTRKSKKRPKTKLKKNLRDKKEVKKEEKKPLEPDKIRDLSPTKKQKKQTKNIQEMKSKKKWRKLPNVETAKTRVYEKKHYWLKKSEDETETDEDLSKTKSSKNLELKK